MYQPTKPNIIALPCRSLISGMRVQKSLNNSGSTATVPGCFVLSAPRCSNNPTPSAGLAAKLNTNPTTSFAPSTFLRRLRRKLGPRQRQHQPEKTPLPCTQAMATPTALASQLKKRSHSIQKDSGSSQITCSGRLARLEILTAAVAGSFLMPARRIQATCVLQELNWSWIGFGYPGGPNCDA